MSDIFFKVFYNLNYVSNSLYSYNLQWKIPPDRKYIIITKQKVKILWFCTCDKLHVHKFDCVCAPAHMCAESNASQGTVVYLLHAALFSLGPLITKAVS